jgi:hypothetical protein
VQREEKTTEELQQLIQDKLNALQHTLNSSEKITAPLVYRHAPDESGCNWNAESYTGSAYYRPGVRMLIEELRWLYNLRA